jgi:hypothetical protein
MIAVCAAGRYRGVSHFLVTTCVILSSMAYSESYTCDICGNKKGEGGQWFLSWLDCLPSGNAQTQPVIKLTRWQKEQAHSPEVQHLCGARCAGTMMDRWMAEQHEDPTASCA